mmetsp:Transcript_103848/g.293694  ORF Transcript_103848/g.293694 Transcript_103848/m.293694 type:complete len:319 (-) Transcript_103848:139-1095(-)
MLDWWPLDHRGQHAPHAVQPWASRAGRPACPGQSARPCAAHLGSSGTTKSWGLPAPSVTPAQLRPFVKLWQPLARSASVLPGLAPPGSAPPWPASPSRAALLSRAAPRALAVPSAWPASRRPSVPAQRRPCPGANWPSASGRSDPAPSLSGHPPWQSGWQPATCAPPGSAAKPWAWRPCGRLAWRGVTGQSRQMTGTPVRHSSERRPSCVPLFPCRTGQPWKRTSHPAHPDPRAGQQGHRCRLLAGSLRCGHRRRPRCPTDELRPKGTNLSHCLLLCIQPTSLIHASQSHGQYRQLRAGAGWPCHHQMAQKRAGRGTT